MTPDRPFGEISAVYDAAHDPAFLDAVRWMRSITDTVIRGAGDNPEAAPQVAIERRRLEALDRFLRDTGQEVPR